MSTPESPLRPRYTLQEGPDGLTITVPFPKKPTIVTFLARNGFAILAVFALAVMSPFVPMAALGLAIGLVFLAVAGLFLWITIRFKREVLRFSDDVLRMEVRGLVSRSIIQFPLSNISNLRVHMGGGAWYLTPEFADRFVPRFLAHWANWLLAPTLAFDHGPVLVRFAFGLKEWEARMLHRDIAERFPQIVA